jgi:hypothetical protein
MNVLKQTTEGFLFGSNQISVEKILNKLSMCFSRPQDVRKNRNIKEE